jgi:glutaconate CoA-transferase, subunit B
MCKFLLISYHPFSLLRQRNIKPESAIKDIQDNCGFELLVMDNVEETRPPAAEELRILRGEVDPYKYVIGR